MTLDAYADLESASSHKEGITSPIMGPVCEIGIPFTDESTRHQWLLKQHYFLSFLAVWIMVLMFPWFSQNITGSLFSLPCSSYCS